MASVALSAKAVGSTVIAVRHADFRAGQQEDFGGQAVGPVVDVRAVAGTGFMASVALSAKAVGSTVKLKVGGTARNFIVVHKGKPSAAYDASCDGVWVSAHPLK